jgi:anion-transporting  ArsA/GET3 family ATPase
MEAVFLKKRFVIVAGKGGVGKSTVCAALGLAAARAGRRTIIAELNTREKIPHLFGVAPSGYTPGRVADNLYSLNIQPEPALHEYGVRKVRLERIYKTVFENEAVKRLLRMIPGMNELLLLGKAFDLERDRDRRGKPDWDMVIVDAPATGHGVSLLRLPQTILEVVSTGPMAEEVRAMRDLLVDPRRTAINLVTLPEEMPVRETFDLLHQVDTTLEIAKGYLFINGIWPRVVSKRDLEPMRLLRDAARGEDPIVDGAMSCMHAQVQRRTFQEPYLRELRRKVDMPAIEVPFLFRREFARDAITVLSDHILKEIERVEAKRRRA